MVQNVVDFFDDAFVSTDTANFLMEFLIGAAPRRSAFVKGRGVCLAYSRNSMLTPKVTAPIGSDVSRSATVRLTCAW